MIALRFALIETSEPEGLAASQDELAVSLLTFYSVRRASIGLIEAARRAGINPATAAQIPSIIIPPRYAHGVSVLTR